MTCQTLWLALQSSWTRSEDDPQGHQSSPTWPTFPWYTLYWHEGLTMHCLDRHMVPSKWKFNYLFPSQSVFLWSGSFEVSALTLANFSFHLKMLHCVSIERPENLSKCNQGGWWSSSLLSRVMMMMMERPHFQRLMGSPDPQAIHMFVVGQNLFFFFQE